MQYGVCGIILFLLLFLIGSLNPVSFASSQADPSNEDDESEAKIDSAQMADDFSAHAKYITVIDHLWNEPGKGCSDFQRLDEIGLMCLTLTQGFNKAMATFVQTHEKEIEMVIQEEVLK